MVTPFATADSHGIPPQSKKSEIMKIKSLLLGLVSASLISSASAASVIVNFPMTGDSVAASIGSSIATFGFSGTANYTDVAATTGFTDAVNQTGGWQNTGSYWQLTLDLTGYTDATISSWGQRSSNTGPSEFRVDISYNGGDSFTTIISPYTVPNTTAGYSNAGFALGASADNNSDVIIRWVNFSDLAVSSANPVASSGTSRFTNFSVTAIPEPTTALLGGLGMLALLRRRRG